jgi:1,2-diacylglycerol 3-beta-galactosyltransferase
VGVATVISSFLPGQEEGNVDFVSDGGWGGFIDNNEGIGEEVGRLLRDDGERKRRGEKAKKMGRGEASDEIAKLLLDMLPA